jgi:hypothetical protein
MRSALLVVCGLLWACSDPVYTVTVVELGPDGPRVIAEDTITESEQQRALGARGHGEISAVARFMDAGPPRETECDKSRVWIYDQYDYTGNMLCVTGVGAASLSQFVHHIRRIGGGGWLPVSWTGYARSAYAPYLGTTSFSNQGTPVGTVIAGGIYHLMLTNFRLPDGTLTTADSMLLQ